ncbi:hypothetical protein ACFLW4_03975 [Chloroflexota bacterium]
MENNSWLVKVVTSDYLKLVPILGLAFYLASITHQGYPYLVHLDEWVHLACSNEIIKGATAFGLTDPFRGGTPIHNQLLEVGFHVFWAVFHQISGISWLDIFKYFPGIVFMVTVLSVYILAQRQGFGWEAALLTCLIPTTVGILGPGLLVPVAMGLLFIALSLFVAFTFKSRWSYLVLFIFSAFLLSMHAATAVGLIIILIPYIVLNLKGNFKHSLGVTLAITTPFLAALVAVPSIWALVAREVPRLLVQQSIPHFIQIPVVIETYGYLPVLLCLAGTLLLVMRGGIKNYALTLGLLVLLSMLAIYYVFGYGVGMMYYRGLQYAMLMMSIVAGAGLMAVKNLKLPEGFIARLKAPPIMRNVGPILCLILIGLTLYIAIPTRQDAPYYRMIDDEDYRAFVWIRDNVGSSYQKAVLDPWKGTAFTAITGKNVYTWIGERARASDEEAYKFLRDGSEDTAFLKNNGISIVYTEKSVNNPDLVEVRKHVYLLKEAGSQ